MDILTPEDLTSGVYLLDVRSDALRGTRIVKLVHRPSETYVQHEVDGLLYEGHGQDIVQEMYLHLQRMR